MKKDAERSPSFPLITWSGDGKRLAVFVNELYVWDIAGGKPRNHLLPAKPDAIALSKNGEILASAAGPTNRIDLWNLRTGRKLSACAGHKEWISNLAFSPDGKTLASVSFDNTAALWDIPSGSLRWPLPGHAKAVFYLAFSPDGRTLVTREGDSTLRFWHVRTGREIMSTGAPFARWEHHFGGMRFSPDSSMMAAGLPTQIRFFRAPTLAEFDAAEITRTPDR